MKVNYYFVRTDGYTETHPFNWLHYHEARNFDTFLSWKESKEMFPGYLSPEQSDRLISVWNSSGKSKYWWRCEDSPEQ